MCSADHFFEHNFYDFFYFPKRHAWFSRKVHSLSIYYKKRKLRFFLVENGKIFSSPPEAKLFC